MIIWLLRWFRGLVRFECRGNTGRFMSACAGAGIDIFRSRIKTKKLRGIMSLPDYLRVRPVARRAGVKLQHKRVWGLPFFVHRYRRRYGLAAGALLFFGILWFLSSFIWRVDFINAVAPGEPIPNVAQIEAIFADHGLTAGVKKSTVNAAQLRADILAAHPELSWLSVNLHGSAAEVDLRFLDKADKNQSKIPGNIVSISNGIVVKTLVTSGQCMVKAGDAVQKGEVLVSGYVDHANGVTTLVRAGGSVIAKTVRSLTFEQPLTFTEKISAGANVYKRKLTFFGVTVPLSVGAYTGKADLTSTRNFAGLFGKDLPIFVDTEVYSPYQEVVKMVGYGEAEKMAGQKSAVYVKSLPGTVRVKSRSERIVRKSDKVVLAVSLDCEEEIGVFREITDNR